ncbi:hypothetical protein ACR6C2_37445 [Streptomyces sp. INA 01156]
MGVAEHELPASTEERGQLYRSLLADRRMLVLLDNAVDDRQVRPLLPGTDGCRTLITGRDSFTTLPGVRPVPLGPMSAREGHRMLSAIVGPERTGTSPTRPPASSNCATGCRSPCGSWRPGWLRTRADDSRRRRPARTGGTQARRTAGGRPGHPGGAVLRPPAGDRTGAHGLGCPGVRLPRRLRLTGGGERPQLPGGGRRGRSGDAGRRPPAGGVRSGPAPLPPHAAGPPLRPRAEPRGPASPGTPDGGRRPVVC